MAAVHAALTSPEGAATAGDLANFAQAGLDLLMFGRGALPRHGRRRQTLWLGVALCAGLWVDRG